MLNLERYWYRSSLSWMALVLLPLSFLFQFAVFIRRFFYFKKWKTSHRFDVPVIVVGNITVGGTGKTPFVIWLANLLKEKGYHPGIVSRGVGGKQQKIPRWVSAHSKPNETGDEALLLFRRANCPVVIGVDRVAAVRELLSKTNCDVVISDDGLQHYRLQRDIEIALVDGMRRLGNRCLLPAGPLREPVHRLSEVDFVVENVLPFRPRSDCSEHERSLAFLYFSYELLPNTKKNNKWFNVHLMGDELVSLHSNQKMSLESISPDKIIHAVAGIGNHSRFFSLLRMRSIKLIEHRFPDHYLYQEADFKFDNNEMIIMTEKDAVKCEAFADERFWFLPVEIETNYELAQNILKKLGHQDHFKKDTLIEAAGLETEETV